MRTTRSAIALLSLIFLFACTNSTSPDESPDQVTILAYDAFTPAEGIFDDFTGQTGAKVRIITSGDSGELISKAILTAGRPEGDVLWGLDNTTLSRAKEANLLEDYTPVDEGDICVNYDKEWFASRGLTPPSTFEQLARPEYKGLLVTQDPVASSPGLGFLLATIAHFGDDRWQQYWRSLLANKARIAPDWTTAYTIDFSGSSGKGKYPLVVSYGSSPPAEVVFASTPIDEPPTAVIESTCFRQIEYVGVLRGTKNPSLADSLVDYLLDKRFQESMPLSLFVFPVNPDAVLPPVFARFAVRPSTPLMMDPSVIQKNRDSWLDQWRALAT